MSGGVGEASFYAPVRFTLVEAECRTSNDAVELVLTSGERIRFPADPAALRMVLFDSARPAAIHLPVSVRVYLCTTPCDMRRSFEGLYALVSGVMQLKAFQGHLFIFSTHRRDQIRIFIETATGSPSGRSGWRKELMRCR